MEAQIPRQHGHNGDEQLPVMQGEGHEHHEKKSVIKNVKDKAKSKVRKIKETLTKHGHGHDHGHEHDHDRQSHDDDDDNDDEEQLVKDSEVHGAPMYESAAARNGVGAGHQLGVNLEKPIIMEEDRYKNTITGTQTKPFSQAEYTRPEHGEPTRLFSQTEHAKPDHGQFRNFKHGIDQLNPEGKVGIPSQMTEGKHNTSLDSQTRPFSHVQHAKPEYEQFRNIDHGIDGNEGNHKDQIGIPSQMEQDQYSIDRNEGNHKDKIGIPSQMEQDQYSTITDPRSRPFSQPQHETSGLQFDSFKRGMDENQGTPRVKIGTPTRMEEDHNVPKDGQEPSNYQTKVADPTGAGGAEAGITPILRSFDKLSLSDEPHPLPKSDDFDSPPEIFTGTHNQFSPELIPENAPVDPKDPGYPLKALASDGEKKSSYTDKISSATSALTGKAIAAKDIVASKLGYDEKRGSEISRTGEKEGSGIAKTGQGEESGYTEKLSSATSALTGKAIAAKDIVASKFGYGEKEGSGITNTGEKDGSKKTNTGEKDGSRKTNTGEKDGSGKTNTGEKDGSGKTNTGEKEGSGILEPGRGGASGGVTATVADYANRTAATVTSVGTSVLSKVHGGTTGENKETSKATEQTVENKGTGKGVTSYLAEKLRPSEEDKALSEVISDTLYRKKPETDEKPIGKVMVSDEVAKKLGTREDVKREEESVDAQVVADVCPDVVERVKGWFGIGQSQSPQASQADTNAAQEQFPSSEVGGEKRLQESTN